MKKSLENKGLEECPFTGGGGGGVYKTAWHGKG